MSCHKDLGHGYFPTFRMKISTTSIVLTSKLHQKQGIIKGRKEI